MVANSGFGRISSLFRPRMLEGIGRREQPLQVEDSLPGKRVIEILAGERARQQALVDTRQLVYEEKRRQIEQMFGYNPVETSEAG
jgi:hypothetical protein